MAVAPKVDEYFPARQEVQSAEEVAVPPVESHEPLLHLKEPHVVTVEDETVVGQLPTHGSQLPQFALTWFCVEHVPVLQSL